MGRKVSTGTFELEKDRERERLKNVKLGEEILNKDLPDIKNSAKSPTKFIKIVIQAKPAERIDQEVSSSASSSSSSSTSRLWGSFRGKTKPPVIDKRALSPFLKTAS